MNKGKIIFLNGVSSTGKSTLSKVLQQKLEEPYHWLNVDEFIAFTDMSRNPKNYFEEGKDPVSVFPHIVKLYSDLGVNVIVDVAFVLGPGPVLYKALEAMNACVDMLHNYPLYHVEVTCPIEELNRRHIERGNRGGKLSEDRLEEFRNSTSDLIYDISVDTYLSTTEECADKIISIMQDTEPNAFKAIKASV